MATTADVWADFEKANVDKAIDQWRKRFQAKEEHFEH